MAAGNKDRGRENAGWNFSSPLFILGAVLLVVSLVFFLLIPSVDIAVNGWFAGQSSGMLALMFVMTLLGSVPVLALIAIVVLIVLFLKGRKRDMPFYGMAAISAGIVDLVLKYIILRDRPSDIVEPALVYLTPAYPSGHSLGSMVIFGGIALMLLYHQAYGKEKWPVLLIFLFPLIIGLSRLFLGVHWLSDVLGGWGIGLLVLWLIAPILDSGLCGKTDKNL